MNDARNAMLTSYMALARHSWEDEDFKARLQSSPREALADHGWELPEGTEVEVSFTGPEGSAPENGEQRSAGELARAWEQAIAEGRLHLLVPSAAAPGLETTELSDEALESAAGGAAGICGCDAARLGLER